LLLLKRAPKLRRNLGFAEEKPKEYEGETKIFDGGKQVEYVGILEQRS
jgi:hypothetical protein